MEVKVFEAPLDAEVNGHHRQSMSYPWGGSVLRLALPRLWQDELQPVEAYILLWTERGLLSPTSGGKSPNIEAC